MTCRFIGSEVCVHACDLVMSVYIRCSCASRRQAGLDYLCKVSVPESVQQETMKMGEELGKMGEELGQVEGQRKGRCE